MTTSDPAPETSPSPPTGSPEISRGKLTIFLGYAPGIDLTTPLITAGLDLLDNGRDVILALPFHFSPTGEIHSPGKIQSLPASQIEYRGELVSEIDLDAVLAANPHVVLIDDLAHTNAPGMRHSRRYLDVAEILAAGIDVIATLTVANLESLVDSVQQITGYRPQETIPDSILDQAGELEFCDLAPDQIIDRFNRGLVPGPLPEPQFFKIGNLIALREMAFRKAADWNDQSMRKYMESRSIPGPWPVRERILVAVSAHPLSERLVRAARRLADDLRAEWYAVYVETPDRLRFSSASSAHVAQTLRLAEDLGAHVVILQGQSIPETLIDFAKLTNITKIIAGKPLRPRLFELLRGSLIDEIIRLSGKIDVYVISDPSGPLDRVIPATWRPHSNAWRYLYSTIGVVLITLLCFPIHLFIEPTNLVMLYLVGVVVSAMIFGRGPAMLASILSVLAFDFFFIEPHLSFDVVDTQYLITFLGFLSVGVVISSLTSLLRDQVKASQQREAHTAALYVLGRDLAVAVDQKSLLPIMANHISQSLDHQVIFLLDEDGRLTEKSATSGFTLDPASFSAAEWVLQHGQEAGHGTLTLPHLPEHFVPLTTSHGVIGVLGIKPNHPSPDLSREQSRLLNSFASLAALALERARLSEETSRMQVLDATEKLQTALLNSISHDLRTPLASITGVLSGLRESETSDGKLDRLTRIDLLETAWGEADRLNRYVGNLLDMTRLQAGALKINRELCDPHDLVGSTLQHMGARLEQNPIKIEIPDEVPMISVDFVLIQQVLINLLDNAAKYSDPDTPIEIKVSSLEGTVRFQITDRGIGIPEGELDQVFERFYQTQRSLGHGGTGLGLSICKGIVEAHGGKIWAENNPNGGAVLTFTIPEEKTEGSSSNG